MKILEVKNLRKEYKGKDVFANVNFAIESGKFVFLVGKNGAGKTTIFKAIKQMIAVDDGEILIESSVLKKNTDIGFVTDKPLLYENLTVLESLELVLDINDIKKNEKEKREILKKFLCEDIKNKKIKECSLGMTKRTQLMCAMVLEPKLMLMDEFFSGIDQENISKIKTILKQYVQKGNTIFMTSHINEFKEELADEVISIDSENL